MRAEVEEFTDGVPGVKRREQEKAAKQSPDGRAFIAAVKSIDRAILAAEDEDNAAMKQALESGETHDEQAVEDGPETPEIDGETDEQN